MPHPLIGRMVELYGIHEILDMSIKGVLDLINDDWAISNEQWDRSLRRMRNDHDIGSILQNAQVSKRRKLNSGTFSIFKIQKPSDEHKRALLFLYGKELFSTELPTTRLGEFLILFGKDDTEADDIRGLLRLLRPEGDTHRNDLPDETQSFESFCLSAKDWANNSSSYVWFRDCSRLQSLLETGPVLAQRQQNSNLCYVHCAVITYYYLQVLGLGIRVDMINITKLISTTFMPDLLAAHIFHYRGGNSRQVLKSFLEPRSMTFTPGLDQIDSAFLEKYGPGLVSHFSAHDDILVDGRFSFSGEPTGRTLASTPWCWSGKHAMVLVLEIRRTTGLHGDLFREQINASEIIHTTPAFIYAG